VHFASDYFEQLYAWACHLVRIGKAYVDDQSAHDIREGRGTLTSPGRNSPFRDRSVEENTELFARMREGEFRNGERVLRAKIDMESANLNLRDPVIYRILSAGHPRTGAAWHIYPSYDFAHGQGDAIEEVSHSLCTLEFEDHGPLYDWFLDNLVRLYGRLFSAASPGPTDLAADLDPHSMQTLSGCLVERATASDPHGQALQFERQGYFTHDDDSHPERLVFNRTALLRESPGKPPTAHLDLLRR
jgi:hypothetical protein